MLVAFVAVLAAAPVQPDLTMSTASFAETTENTPSKAAETRAAPATASVAQSRFPWTIGGAFFIGAVGAIGVISILTANGAGKTERPANPREWSKADVANAVSVLGTELAKIAGLFADGSSKHARYASALTEMEDKIASVQTPEQLRAIANLLAAENHRMRVETQSMARALEDSQNQIATLRTSLASAEEEVLRDPLTGVSNRRAFDAALRAEVNAASATEQPLSLAMIDIDEFKAINDRHGHVAGDSVLASVAQLLAGHARNGDSVARYGGEEFALILPRTESTAASILAERLRQRLMAERVHVEGVPIALTASIGVAQLRPAEGADQLLKRADRHLYRAKELGRNRVVTTGT